MEFDMKKFISCILVMVITMSLFGTLPANAENDSLEPNAQIETDISVQGTNSFGNLMTRALTTEMDKQEENNGCNIFSIEMNGANASVSFETTEDCTLLVAVYTENGEQMLASGNTAVVKGETETLVTIDTDSMPQYYYLRGFLVDSDTLRPVCTVYESPNYTQEMQEFFEKTVDDFDLEKVLNLDEDESNNFAVFSDETIIIKQNGTFNRVTKADDNTHTYVIANADDAVKSLKNGNIFTCEYGNETLIVKVDRISISGLDVTVYGQDTSMEEVFDYIKIDATQENEEPTFDASDLPDGVTYNGIVEEFSQIRTNYNMNHAKLAKAIEGEGSISKSLSFSFNAVKLGTDKANVKITGGLKEQIKPTIKFYLSSSYYYLETKIDISSTINVSISGNVKGEIELGTVGFSPIPGVYIECPISFVIEASISLKVSGTLKATVGIALEKDQKAKNISSTPKLELDASIEGSVFIGFAIEGRIGIIDDKISKMGIKSKIGAEISGKIALYKPQSESVKHECKNCIEGNISAKNSLSFEASLLNVPWLSFSNTFYENRVKLCDWYYSIDYNEFEFTSCPHKTYRVTIQLKDTNNKPVIGEKITFGGLYTNVFGTTDQNGKVEGWFSKGEYLFTAKKDDQTVSRKVVIRDNSKSIVLRFKSLNNKDNLDDEIYNQRLSLGGNHSGFVSKDGDLYMWGSNDGGQLGDGTTKDSSIPIKVMENVKYISLGDDHSAEITDDESLYMWGYNHIGEIGIGEYSYLSIKHYVPPTKILDNVKQVALGDRYSAAITTNGDLYTWGWGDAGKLGNGSTASCSSPKKIMSNVKYVTLGIWHSAAIKEDGSLYLWGNNSSGELGNDSKRASYYPVKILDNVKYVSLGYKHSAAITEDGSLYMWGDNRYGQLGNGTIEDSLIPIKIMDNVKYVSIAGNYSAVITEDSNLLTWGSNYAGELGKGDTEKSLIPVNIISDINNVSLGTGFDDGIDGSHSAAVTKNGELYTWGYNYYEQLGNGESGIDENYSKRKCLVPIKIEIPSSNSYSTVSTLSLESNYSTETFNLGQSTTLLADEEYGIPTICGAAISYRGLNQNETYNFYAMKSENAKNPLNSDNLLYITQSVSDDNGNLEIPYVAKEQYKNAVTFVKASSKNDLSSAQVTIPDILCNGEEQFAEPEVTLDGKALTEGVDYDVEKRYNAVYPGEYELIITGIRNYRGEVSATYNIYCEHNFANNKCTICKSLKDSVGDDNGDDVVGVADLVVLQEFLLAKRKDISINADIDKDGVIDVFDLCLLRKILSQLIA